MRKLYVMDDFQTLKDEINRQWELLYKGGPVHDIVQLRNRITYLADDRNCWVFNARMADKEAARLKEELDVLRK